MSHNIDFKTLNKVGARYYEICSRLCFAPDGTSFGYSR